MRNMQRNTPTNMRMMPRKTSHLDATANLGTTHACRESIMAQSNIIQTKDGRVVIARFNTESVARFAAIRDGMWTVMGDVGEYWNVTPRDARRLERAGYELLP